MPAKRGSKYGAVRTGSFASKKEANYAVGLQILAKTGAIWNYQEQARFTLVEGKGSVRAIVYVADFCYQDSDGWHVVDVKGFKTPVYKLKKKMMFLLKGITVEEI